MADDKILKLVDVISRYDKCMNYQFIKYDEIIIFTSSF